MVISMASLRWLFFFVVIAAYMAYDYSFKRAKTKAQATINAIIVFIILSIIYVGAYLIDILP